MASANASNSKLNELLICPVCLDTYREARTLTCLHSFCTECLEGCRRVLRRDIECPVCKRVTCLTGAGVRGLPSDYRIEQIRDFIIADSQHRPVVDSGVSAEPNASLQHCDVCRSQQRASVASKHCVQCLMQLCDMCLHRHNANPVLSAHQVININDQDAAAALFCNNHKEQPIRYFCRSCRVTLCSICAIEHDPSHKPQSLETGIINKYRSRLSEALSVLALRLSEVKARAKRLGALRQSRQNELYVVQQNIRDRASQIINHIKQREAQLLAEAQTRFDSGLNIDGSSSLAELDFRRAELEQLVNDVRQVLGGPPHACLIAFDDVMARVSRLSESSQSSLPAVKVHLPKAVYFIPAPESEMDLMIGCLQECNFSGMENGASEDNDGPSTTSPQHLAATSSPSFQSQSSPQSKAAVGAFENSSATRKRTASILGALSPARKSDARLNRVKGVSRPNTVWQETATHSSTAVAGTSSSSPVRTSPSVTAASSWRDSCSPVAGWRDLKSSPARQINFDATVGSTTGQTVVTVDMAQSPASPSVTSSMSRVSSPVACGLPQLLFNIEQVGGMPGMIHSPSSVTFTANGDVLVCESDRRLQLFDRRGRSVRVIGWGSTKPQAVSFSGSSGLMAIAEKTSQTIRFLHTDGSDSVAVQRWPDRLFGLPCSVAVCTALGRLVVVDSDRRSVTTHSIDGATLSRCASERLGSPTHVATDDNGTIFVSDALHCCVKVFDSSSQFVLQFQLPPYSGNSGAPRPYGLCIGPGGRLLVCDHDNHRILMFTSDGEHVGELLPSSSAEGGTQLVRYPCGVAVTQTTDEGGNAKTLVAVAESCSGLLDNHSGHHAVKLFML